MRFVAIDPGANFTGVAVLENDGTFSFHGEFADPVLVAERMLREAYKDPDDTLTIVEDFLGGGGRDKYVTSTIKVVGYLYLRCREARIRVILVANQQRLANVDNVPAEITGKDERAAAAHALTQREKRLKK